MAATPVVPIPGLIYQTAATSVVVFAAGPNGGIITNPLDDADQGAGIVVPEVLWVNPIGAAQNGAFGTTFGLQPGQSWTVIPGQSTPTSVLAPTTGHRFSAVSY